MPRYVKKPIVIEAFQFDTEIWYHTDQCIKDGVDPKVMEGYHEIKKHEDGSFFISTLEGDMMVHESDFVIKGLKGEFYPCRSDIFNASYDAWFEDEE